MLTSTTSSSSLLLLLLLSRQLPAISPLRPIPEPSDQLDHHRHPWRSFEKLIDVEKGMNVTGISNLKKYFHHFGYLPADQFSDEFDEKFETAVSLYQSKLGLNITGKLDSSTVSQITSPRCGVSDDSTVRPQKTHVVKHYAFFPGQPTWLGTLPPTLTYAFSSGNSVGYLDREDIRAVFRRSFDRWSATIPVTFTETTDDSTADVRIGFYTGDHGDGEPFDGVLGVLAHAFSPESGRLHLDAAERWAVDFGKEKGSAAVDLESVATHEIGHVLGLGHSSVKESVMYPSLSPRTRKFELRVDDVEGVQALYGTNPSFQYSSLAQSETSSSPVMAVSVWLRRSTVAGGFLVVAAAMFIA